MEISGGRVWWVAIDPARNDHRQLHFEVELALREQRPALGAADATDRGLDVGGPGDADLAAAVVPARRRP